MTGDIVCLNCFATSHSAFFAKKFTQPFPARADTLSVILPNPIPVILRSLYPSLCGACDLPLRKRIGLCDLCLHSCTAIHNACPTCAHPIAGTTAIHCKRCTERPPIETSCTAAFEYGGQIAVALKQLKFLGRNDIAKSLAPLLLPSFQLSAQRCDLALPIPLHRKRLRQRGFNQSQRLLLPLAKSCDLPVSRNALSRVRHTLPQARLSASKRASNLQNAFVANAPKVTGKRVLLLDDIRTTGQTLRQATCALLRAGASEVHCFVVARAESSRTC